MLRVNTVSYREFDQDLLSFSTAKYTLFKNKINCMYVG